MDTPMTDSPPAPATQDDTCMGAFLHGFATVSFTFVTMAFWWRSLELPVVPQAQASLLMLLHMGSVTTAWLSYRHGADCLARREAPPAMAKAVTPLMIAMGSIHVALVATDMMH